MGFQGVMQLMMDVCVAAWTEALFADLGHFSKGTIRVSHPSDQQKPYENQCQ